MSINICPSTLSELNSGLSFPKVQRVISCTKTFGTFIIRIVLNKLRSIVGAIRAFTGCLGFSSIFDKELTYYLYIKIEEEIEAENLKFVQEIGWRIMNLG